MNQQAEEPRHSEAVDHLYSSLATYEQMLEDENKREQNAMREFNRCHTLGWLETCPRFLVLNRLAPDSSKIPPQVLRAMKEGRDSEVYLHNKYVEAGIQTLPVKGHPKTDKDLNLRGEADDLFVGMYEPNKVTVIDYKTISPDMFRKVKECENLRDLDLQSDQHIRHYRHQMAGYTRLYGVEDGMIIFQEKMPGGATHIIEGCRNEDLEDNVIVPGLRDVNHYVEREELPSLFRRDACRDCWKREYCWGDEADVPKGKIEMVNDASLLKLLEEREALKEMKKRYDQIDKQVKDEVRGKCLLVNSRFKVLTVDQNRKTYNIPPEIKRQYEDSMSLQVIRITALDGDL